MGIRGGVSERHFGKDIYVCLLVILSTFTIRLSKLTVPTAYRNLAQLPYD